jgi:hypothetical protein
MKPALFPGYYLSTKRAVVYFFLDGYYRNLAVDKKKIKNCLREKAF